MRRGIIVTSEEPLLTEDEIIFYLPRVISSYDKLVNRLKRRDVVIFTSYIASFVLAFTAVPGSTTTIPFIAVELGSELATAALFLIGSATAFFAAFDRSAAITYCAEIEVLHRLKYGTDAPMWYLTVPSSLNTLIILSPGTRIYKALFWVYAWGLMAIIFSIGFKCIISWSSIDWTVRGVYLTGFGIFFLFVFIYRRLKKSDKETISKIQEALSKLGSTKRSEKIAGGDS